MNYWLVKSEPNVYAWNNLVKEKKTIWDGVRNFQARNNLRAMKKGDLVFFYHSNVEKTIVGIAEVVKEAFPDPPNTNWVAIELKPQKNLKKEISLETIKNDPFLADMVLVKNARLSVQPVTVEEYTRILILAEK